MEFDHELKTRGHQGMNTNWRYTNPDGSGGSVMGEKFNLNDLYAAYKSGGAPAPAVTPAEKEAAPALSKPSGNLVDTVI